MKFHSASASKLFCGGRMVFPLAALVAGLALVGCTNSTVGGSYGNSDYNRSRSGRTELTGAAVEHPSLEGIPLPIGFQLVDDRSIGWSSGQLRHASYVFSGNVAPARVSRFFEEYMPSAGFTLRYKRFDRGVYVLEFESSTERSTVRTKRHKFKTELIIDLSPRSKGAVEREPSPIKRRQ